MSRRATCSSRSIRGRLKRPWPRRRHRWRRTRPSGVGSTTNWPAWKGRWPRSGQPTAVRSEEERRRHRRGPDRHQPRRRCRTAELNLEYTKIYSPIDGRAGAAGRPGQRGQGERCSTAGDPAARPDLRRVHRDRERPGHGAEVHGRDGLGSEESARTGAEGRGGYPGDSGSRPDRPRAGSKHGDTTGQDASPVRAKAR